MIFSLIGISLALAYVALYQGVRLVGCSDFLANMVALISTTIVSIILNRRQTFQSSGSAKRDYTQSALVFFTAWSLSTLTIEAAPGVKLLANVPTSIMALAANLSTSVLKFTLLKYWVYSGKKAGAISNEDDGDERTQPEEKSVEVVTFDEEGAKRSFELTGQ